MPCHLCFPARKPTKSGSQELCFPHNEDDTQDDWALKAMNGCRTMSYKPYVCSCGGDCYCCCGGSRGD